MAGSGARQNRAEHLARHDTSSAYLGYLESPTGTSRAVLKCFDCPKVLTTTPYSWLMHAGTIIKNNARGGAAKTGEHY